MELKNKFARYNLQTLFSVEELIVKDDVDGLPLFKSSNICVWPLLAKIDNLVPTCVFPIFISVGVSKPNNLEFLLEAVDEMKKLTNEGICYARITDIIYKSNSLLISATPRQGISSKELFRFTHIMVVIFVNAEVSMMEAA